MTPKTKARLILFAKLAVTLSLLAVTLWLVRLDVLADRLRHADVGLLAVASAILVAGGFAGAASWFFILRTRLPGLPYLKVAACHWSGMFFNSFLPSNVGGDVIKGYIVVREQGQLGFVVASLLADRMINLGMLVALGVFTLLVQTVRLVWTGVFLLFLVLLVAGTWASARWLHPRLQRVTRQGLRGRLARGLIPLFELAGTPRLFAPTLLAALTSQALKIWPHVWIIHALKLSIPTACVWQLIPLFGIVSALPVSFGGLGLRELVAQNLAGPMHLDNTHLVMLSLASHLVFVLVNMLGLIPFLFARRKKGKDG